MEAVSTLNIPIVFLQSKLTFLEMVILTILITNGGHSTTGCTLTNTQIETYACRASQNSIRTILSNFKKQNLIHVVTLENGRHIFVVSYNAIYKYLGVY